MKFFFHFFDLFSKKNFHSSTAVCSLSSLKRRRRWNKHTTEITAEYQYLYLNKWGCSFEISGPLADTVGFKSPDHRNWKSSLSETLRRTHMNHYMNHPYQLHHTTHSCRFLSRNSGWSTLPSLIGRSVKSAWEKLKVEKEPRYRITRWVKPLRTWTHSSAFLKNSHWNWKRKKWQLFGKNPSWEISAIYVLIAFIHVVFQEVWFSNYEWKTNLT